MNIRTKNDLKMAYEVLYFYIENIDKCKNRKGAENTIKDYKKAIREYNHRKIDQRLIEGDYDSYTMLIEFPTGVTMEYAEEYFNDNYRLIAQPSQYDCTGQHFTTGYKFVERHGRIYCYHHICVDV